MDWYYPVLTGATIGAEAKTRLLNQWDEFIIDGRGVRCVNDEDWVTAAETAECSLAHAAAGEIGKAKELLSWTRAHRNDDGSYFTPELFTQAELCFQPTSAVHTPLLP